MRRFSPRQLRAAREEAGLRVERVAADAMVSSRIVQAWEAGKHVPDANKLARVADVLGLPLDSFYEECDPSEVTPRPRTKNTSSSCTRL